MTFFSEFVDRLQVLKLIPYYNVAYIGDFRNVIPLFSKCMAVVLHSLENEGSFKERINMPRIRQKFWRC